uniref:Doublecortin domain-containing protein n=1 Tax=Anabas testudineus TaxID=64144 RepID=A0AAQ6IAJ1_ANATE
MNEAGLRRILPDQSSGSGHTSGTPRHPGITDPILSKRVCFYKSGDPQFNGLRMVINNRTFKTFDALLDSLSKKVPLPFGVRNITTPRGIHAIYTLDELEDGKSYICSDSHKVKPINLALARKKLPPWYHARPVSSRRRTVQQARFFPGKSIHKQEPVVVRTPKRLLVFRNGDPTVKHTVVLHKRTTPTFESVLEYISELTQFHVVKLHTLDGRRVDGLPALILCSGTVVAAGREPFTPANYDVQKSPAPTRLPANRMGLRRLKALNRKKKSLSYLSKPRNFSPSSERYIVNRIRNSIAENGAEGLDCLLPTEDDIEKSFRVNQDGSMTVEMRVRLTIKEEETIHWTTTLKRSSVANQLNETSLQDTEVKLETCSPKPNSLDLQSPAASIDTINKDKNKDNNDEDPPSLSNGVFSQSSNEEDNVGVAGSPRRAPTPGHNQIRKKQTSVESMKSGTAEGIQEGMVGSYSYREQIENGATTEQYCMVKQSTTRPVPKPRRLSSMDAYTTNSRNVSTFKSAEILQIESSGEEITETVLHIYEQQTCQDNFLANICAQGMSASRIPFNRPATSETGHLSSKNEFHPELWRPLTASESINNWRAESMSSDFTLPPVKTGATQATNNQQLPESTTEKDKPQQKEGSKDKRGSTKPKLVNKGVWQPMSPGKGQKKKRMKGKTFSSAGFIKRIYGNKSKSAKSRSKLKKRPIHGGDKSVTAKSSQPSDHTIKCIIKEPKIPSRLKDNTSETISLETSRLNVASTEVNQPKGKLTRQTSVHQEKQNENESLSGFNSTSSVTNEYVEKWLEKAHLNPTVYTDEESKQSEAATPVQMENRNNGGLISVAGEMKCLEENSEIQTCQTLKSDTVSKCELGKSVKLKIQSFENKPSQLMEDTTVAQRTVDHTNTENRPSAAQTNMEEIKPNGICSVEMKSSPVKGSLLETTLPSMLSLEIPPPPAAEELSNSDCCMIDVSPVLSSPLYEVSSVSSQKPDNHTLSMSPASDEAISPTDHTMEMAASIQTDMPSTPREAPLPRTPSIKRAPLVSNLSLERKMSVRRACLDKYTLCSDATSEATTSSNPISTLDDNVMPNGICSTGTPQPSNTVQEETQKSISHVISSPSCCTSASPVSLTSDERMSSASISTSEAPTPGNLLFKESMQKEVSSSQHSVKKVKLMSSPSPERKHQSKKLPSELSNNSPKSSSLHNHPPHKTGILYKPKLQKKQSPYSQSLDMMSPPVRQKSIRQTLSRNLSSDNASEPSNKTRRKTSSQRKHNQTPQSIKATDELDKTPTCETDMQSASHVNENQAKLTADLTNAAQEKSVTGSQPINIAHPSNMKPVLDTICYSIKSIRQITQSKRRSCLEKSNSLPDFSSHVASTFGSSSKVLLAFLSVMTLKECITNFNMDELNANNVSCAEALKMIDSLREIASIEDSQRLKCSLSDLQQSASKQLLKSWKGFQELSDKINSCSSTPNYSEHGLIPEAALEKGCGIEENVLNELMDNLDIPERLKEELASLSMEVKSESKDEEKLPAKIIKELTLNENSSGKTSPSQTENTVPVGDVTQDERANVDVKSIIKKFVDINQPKESNLGSVALITETTKHKTAAHATKDDDGQNVAAKCQRADTNEMEIPEERQLYGEVLSVEDDRGVMTLRSNDAENQHQGQTKDKSNKETAGSHENSLEKQSCSFETEKQDMECRQLQTHSEESTSIPENELTYMSESGLDEEGQNKSSVNKDVEGKESCKESLCRSEVLEQHSLEEPEVECEEINQESSEGDLSNHESHSEEEENKKPSSNYYVEMNFSRMETTSSADSNALSNPASPFNAEERASSSEAEQLEVITEESLSVPGEEQESVEMEEHLDELPAHEDEMKTCQKLQASIEEAEEDKASPGYMTKTKNAVDGERSILIENQDLNTKIDNSCLIKSDSLSKRYSFNADEDSGNDHISCEELAEVEQPKIKEEQISSSNEEELSYYEKEFSSEEEHPDSPRAPAVAKEPEVTKCENVVHKHQSEEIISQSVAERVSLLEKQVADAQRKKNVTESSAFRRFSQKNAHRQSDVEDSPSESPTSQSALCTRSAPQSSLSFSYDSISVIATEPEGNRVRSIREMFLAKSTTDIQHGNRQFPSPHVSELSELRAQTSGSGGYQSQTSSDVSSGEDDSARKSITKGFVRRTIERLYGLRLNQTRPKAVSELSYFNSTNALDTLSEATRCIAFNAQVGPGDSLPLDNERWLLRENALIRKSVSDPVGINKTFTNSPQGEGICQDTEKNTPYSLFSTKPEQEDKKSFSRKCTYFSLPHASDSDACQDDQSIVSRSSVNEDSVTDTKDNPEDTKTWAERSTTLPTVSDFKMMDNKVHPLIQVPSDGEAVVVQPGRGQGVVNRRLQEPDVLDFMYNFCGQHCPIL